MKKNLFRLTIAVIIPAFTLLSCKEKDKNISVSSVRLDKTEALTHVGDTLFLSATIRPFNATNRTTVWTSNDTIVAIADSNIIFAKRLGKATITVITQDGNHTATCDVTVTMPATRSGCNGSLPGWGWSLGDVSFASNQEWTITNGVLTQIWSDAVTTTKCNTKTTFEGEPFSNSTLSNADCRSNPDYPGDLFSWCAVVRFAEQFCPAPWRVPTLDDFVNLNIILGGTNIAETTENNPTLRDKYLNTWGGFYGGQQHSDNLNNQGVWGMYWSQTDRGSGAFALRFTTDGNVARAARLKKEANTLRCIRDKN